jgi:1-phosphofructokinase family hexose kinase
MRNVQRVVTVTLNTAIDRVLEAPGLAIGEHLKVKQVSRQPAGKAINVSRALAILGGDSIATGLVGRDELDMFEAELHQAGPGRVICQLLTVRGATRENITIIDPQAHVDLHLRDEGFAVTEQDVRRMRTKIDLLARPDALVIFSGSLPRGLSAEAFGGMVIAALRASAKVVLDVEGALLRKTLSTMSALSTADAPMPRLWMVKPNRQELEQAFDEDELNDASAVMAAARRLGKQAHWVALSLGPEGAWLVGDQGVWRGEVELAEREVANTVGCGDCLLAGLLWGQMQGYHPARVLREGLAAAAANAMQSGVACFNSDQITPIRDRASIREVDLSA